MRLLFAAATCLFAAPVVAQDLATGDAIRAALTGNTVQGSMSATGAYTEFYAADGTIKALDYTGAWTVEGDKMCFTYGETPADCWQVMIAGKTLAWVKDGVEGGKGTILPGNPNNF